jgi:hypothetical protein
VVLSPGLEGDLLAVGSLSDEVDPEPRVLPPAILPYPEHFGKQFITLRHLSYVVRITFGEHMALRCPSERYL